MISIADAVYKPIRQPFHGVLLCRFLWNKRKRIDHAGWHSLSSKGKDSEARTTKYQYSALLRAIGNLENAPTTNRQCHHVVFMVKGGNVHSH